jgi:DNA polymerase-4/DNA polymerase V
LGAELGFTFSIGLAPTKVLAKLASKWNKPSGLTVIPGNLAHRFLAAVSPEKVWGIGPNTGALLRKYGVTTALDFAQKDFAWVSARFTKPHIELWQELRGTSVYPVLAHGKETYASIQKTKTFTPPSRDADFVFSQLSKNIEHACIKLRRYNLAATEASFFLKTQAFEYSGMAVAFSHPTAYPHEIIAAVREPFRNVFRPETSYRATGTVMAKLQEDVIKQQDLFGETLSVLQSKKLYAAVDAINGKFGKHKVYLASSSVANRFSAYQGERGDMSVRREMLFKGETARKRLGVPMFMGEMD